MTAHRQGKIDETGAAVIPEDEEEEEEEVERSELRGIRKRRVTRRDIDSDYDGDRRSLSTTMRVFMCKFCGKIMHSAYKMR